VDIERHLLSTVLEEGELRPLIECRVTPEFFEDDEHREVFAYILGFYKQYNEVPSFKAIRQEFPDWKSIDPSEPYLFYVDELRKARQYSIVHEAFTEAHGQLKNRATDEAMATLASALTQANIEITALRDFEIHGDWEEWLDNYLNAPEGLLGLPTGFPMLDYATGGWQPEQLVTLIGPPKAGKSTLLLALAKAVVDYGKRPMFVSFEMSAEEQRMRYYAMVAGVDFEKMQHRRLNPVEKSQLAKALRQREAYPDFIISTDISAGTTIAALHAKAQQYQPDVIMVDGVYMMDSQVPGVTGSMDPRALTELTRGLKRLGQSLRLPTVITHQALESRWNRKTGLTSRSTGYSSSFAQDSDVMIGVEQPDDEDENRRLSILLARNATKRSTMIDWDWSTSTFTEIEGYSEIDPDDMINDEDDVS